MNINNSLNTGLKISEDVIMTATRLAALDVKGVAGLTQDSGLFFKKSPAISIVRMNDVIKIKVSVIVKSGVKAAAVAALVQEAVKENVQNMAGIAVASVDVAVEGISDN